MTWLWIGLGVAAAAGLAALVYWQLIIAEGAYLGPGVVAWTYDWVARRYDAIKQCDPRDEQWFIAAPLLRRLAGLEHPLILDVATGTGRLPLALLRNGFAATGGQIVGLDLSRDMLRQAWAKLQPYDQHVNLLWQDASHLPFDDGTFDAVTCIESLEFLPRPLEAVGEMVRVLAPGGVLFFTNRVGREARLLPGKAIPRPQLEQALAAFPLGEVSVRPWQVNYDLAIARKHGRQRTEGQRGSDWISLLRCPACGGRLWHRADSLSCPVCGRAYAIHQGIVHLAAFEERGV